MFSFLSHHLYLFKKISFITGIISVAGTAIYFGIVQPYTSSKTYEVVKGSTPLMFGNKGTSPFNISGNLYYVDDFGEKKNSPNVLPSLTIDYLKKDSKEKFKNEFRKELRSSLDVDIETEISQENKRNIKDGYLLKTIENLTWKARELSVISDIEIPYKSLLLINRVNKLSKEQIIQDILWSLAEESAFNRTSIRPNSLDINFELQEHTSNLDEKDLDSFPYPANKVNNFFLSFKIFNPNSEKTTILRSITVDPFSEIEVIVNLTRAEIRPFAKPVNIKGYKGVNWNLVAPRNAVWEVKVKKLYPKVEFVDYSFPDMNLIHGRSKFIPFMISDNNSIRSINSPTYKDFKDIATPYLIGITGEIIKKDLETWYGATLSRHLSLLLKDIDALHNFLKKKIFFDSRGRPASVIEQFIEDAEFRKSFFMASVWDKKFGSLFNLLIDNQKNKNPITVQEVYILLSVWKKVLGEIIDVVKVDFIWREDPEISGSIDDNSPFPSVSFEFEQKITWEKDIVIPLKGKWNKDKGCFISEKDSVGSCKSNNISNEISFDFSKKFKKLDFLLAPFKDSLGSYSNILGISVFEKILPDLEEFSEAEEISIPANEFIRIVYKAKESPIRPALANNFDSKDSLSPNVVMGWKAMDISVSYDFSNFHQFFYKLYEKLDKKNISEETITFFGASKIPEKIKQKPISFIAHLVNEIFKYSDQRPWRTFFGSLLEKPFTFSSVQLFSGYSRLFFDVDEWILEKTKTGETTYRLNFDWEKYKPEAKESFLAKPINSEIKNLSETFYIYYSTFFPNPPIIFSFKELDKYQEFIKKEGATTIGFIQSIDKLKTILQQNYHMSFNDDGEVQTSKSFPIKNVVDWNKVKISFVHLELQKAIKSVLSLKNDLSTGLIGWSLWWSSFSIPNFLGEALQRDGFLVNVNMMLEDGSVSFYDFPKSMHLVNKYSMHQWFVEPNFDVKKLNAKGLEKYL